MGKTSIEWTDASWNPIVGCTEISPGCANCYAARLAATRLRNLADYKGLATIPPARWTGEVRFLGDRLNEPLHWIKPRRIFVCDMADLFHEAVQAEWIEKIFYVMLKAPHHTFQVLTKRPERMQKFISKEWRYGTGTRTFLPNVWAGTSVENRHFKTRIEWLRATPARIRFLSLEPLLHDLGLVDLRGIDWVIVGGESGPGARPMHPDWVRSLRDQCQARGVAFFFKQWGEWIHISQIEQALTPKEIDALSLNTRCRENDQDIFFQIGKKRSGRLLDGREWSEFPDGPH
jgi:protein gp37